MVGAKPWRLAQNLRALRLSRGLTMCAMERQTGYGHSQLHNWEHGRTNPNLTSSLDLAEFFGVTVEELCYGILIGGCEKCTSTTSESSETR